MGSDKAAVGATLAGGVSTGAAALTSGAEMAGEADLAVAGVARCLVAALGAARRAGAAATGVTSAWAGSAGGSARGGVGWTISWRGLKTGACEAAGADVATGGAGVVVTTGGATVS